MDHRSPLVITLRVDFDLLYVGDHAFLEAHHVVVPLIGGLGRLHLRRRDLVLHCLHERALVLMLRIQQRLCLAQLGSQCLQCILLDFDLLCDCLEVSDVVLEAEFQSIEGELDVRELLLALNLQLLQLGRDKLLQFVGLLKHELRQSPHRRLVGCGLGPDKLEIAFK